MCHDPPRYSYIVETTRRRGHGNTKMRTWYRYRIVTADGREIVVSRWRSERAYCEMWARKNIQTLEAQP